MLLIRGQSGDYGPVGVGAARWGDAGLKATYYPFGEKRPESNSHWNLDVSNQTAFATYQRDANGTGGTFDYAMNRYYAAQWGRFTTPDPYQASAQLANPQSWNRYSYVENDPVNRKPVDTWNTNYYPSWSSSSLCQCYSPALSPELWEMLQAIASSQRAGLSGRDGVFHECPNLAGARGF
jgi:RHS repeat-associated protein